jgi:hypothetical protein
VAADGGAVTGHLGELQAEHTLEYTQTLEARASESRTHDPERSDAGHSRRAAQRDRSSHELPRLGAAASDVLTDQLNLVYQIFNLQVLNQRSLSDRLFNGETRLQAVLGFQISVSPPRDAENCAAVVEVELESTPNTGPVSLVALMPQEKTYNSSTLSSRSDSLDGSVVSRFAQIGYSGSRRSTDLYLHRDTDTVAFERDTVREAWPWRLRLSTTRASCVFGWEFRPVRGARRIALYSPGGAMFTLKIGRK